jgi:hypothetical protein
MIVRAPFSCTASMVFASTKRAHAGSDRYAIALVERLPHIDLPRDHAGGRLPQLPEAEVGREPGLAVERIVVRIRHAVDRVPQGLAGDGALVRATAADLVVLLDDGHVLAELAGLHRGPFAAGAGADDHEIVLLCVHKPAKG